LNSKLRFKTGCCIECRILYSCLTASVIGYIVLLEVVALQTGVDEKSLVSVILVPVFHSCINTVASSHLIHGPIPIFLQEGKVTHFKLRRILKRRASSGVINSTLLLFHYFLMPISIGFTTKKAIHNKAAVLCVQLVVFIKSKGREWRLGSF
jgi:hypothetical protein